MGGEGVAVLTEVGAALRGGVMVALARTSLAGPLVEETCCIERRMYGNNVKILATVPSASDTVEPF